MYDHQRKKKLLLKCQTNCLLLTRFPATWLHSCAMSWQLNSIAVSIFDKYFGWPWQIFWLTLTNTLVDLDKSETSRLVWWQLKTLQRVSGTARNNWAWATIPLLLQGWILYHSVKSHVSKGIGTGTLKRIFYESQAPPSMFYLKYNLCVCWIWLLTLL